VQLECVIGLIHTRSLNESRNRARSRTICAEAWDEVVDVCMKGPWNAIRATLPSMLERGDGGSIILTSSSAEMVNAPGSAHYGAAKSGVVSLCRVLANEHHLQGSTIRANCLQPTAVWTGMTDNPFFRPDIENPTIEVVKLAFAGLNLLPVPWLEAREISNAVLFFASDEAQYITGVCSTGRCWINAEDSRPTLSKERKVEVNRSYPIL
jgi:(+)-trans-carveol dehydrogenase